jgi:hypothetical protein
MARKAIEVPGHDVLFYVVGGSYRTERGLFSPQGQRLVSHSIFQVGCGHVSWNESGRVGKRESITPLR